MRKAFTLLELLVVIGIMGVLTAAAVLSVFKGEDVARLRGTVRDVFATVRLARSTAMVTLRPCMVTFETKATEEGSQSKITLHSPNLMKTGKVIRARSLEGVWRTIGEGADEGNPPDDGKRKAFVVSNRDEPEADGEPAEDAGGETVEEILFAPVDPEVLKDICLKVVLDSDDEELDFAGEVNEVKRSMVSTFSNIDYLMGEYKKPETKKGEKEEESADEKSGPKMGRAADEHENRSLAWQVNGRCEPHRVYIYPHGASLDEAWVIRVDRFGAAKIYGPGEDEERRR